MDDAYGSMQKKGGAMGGILAGICGCACLAGAIAFVVYLGIYAFNNPDLPNGWTAEGLTQCYNTETGASVAATQAGLQDAELVNSHQVFVAWFVWGFWTTVAPCLAIPLFCIVGCLGLPTLTFGLGGLTSCGVGCSQLFWIIFGSIWRFGGLSACTRDALTAELGTDQEAYDAAV